MSRSRIGLYVCLVVPSLATVQKFVGAPGLLLYILGAGMALQVLPALRRIRFTRRRALLYAAGTLAGFGALFLVGYPLANSGIYGPGSDTDEAYNLAVREMLSGNYPYYARTYLGGAVHHLPGGLVLAAPFVLLGTSAYQNLFWLGVFFVVAWKELRDPGDALLLLWILLALCPVVLHQIVTGVDGIASTVSVLVTLWLLAGATRPATRTVTAVLFALALSNRANFVLILPLAFALLAHRWSLRVATAWIGVTCVALTAVTVPFYLYDRNHFGPLEGLERVSRFEGMLPGATMVLPALAAVLALVMAFRTSTFREALAGIAVVQGFLVLSGTGLTIAQAGVLDFSYTGYGTYFLFPGALAAWSLFVSSSTHAVIGQTTPLPS